MKSRVLALFLGLLAILLLTSATLAETPSLSSRGGMGKVRNNTEIDHADVTFHHPLGAADLL